MEIRKMKKKWVIMFALMAIVAVMGLCWPEGDGLWTADGTVVFFNHILAVVLVFAYTFVVSMALYWLVNRMIPMRVSRSSEVLGLDMSQHGESYNFADATTDEADADGNMKY